MPDRLGHYSISAPRTDSSVVSRSAERHATKRARIGLRRMCPLNRLSAREPIHGIAPEPGVKCPLYDNVQFAGWSAWLSPLAGSFSLASSSRPNTDDPRAGLRNLQTDSPNWPRAAHGLVQLITFARVRR